jgi:myo-inositol 2-dehydrogenase/D-chiro-inositol 1-dehydrogenase
MPDRPGRGSAGPVLRVGLIGCGRIARSVHLNVLTKLPHVDLVAVAEPDPDARNEVCRRAPGVVACAGYEQLLGMADVDAVIICLPPALHAEAAVAAMECGKHVYLEKPLATSMSEARRVLAAWREARVVAMMGFNYRFNQLYQAAKARIRSGRIGDLVCARSVFTSAGPTVPDWKRARQTGGGVLLDLAVHHIDLVRFLFDEEVREVSAALCSQQSADDTALFQLRLENGLPFQSFVSMGTVEEDRFEIYGRSGKITIDRHRALAIEITDIAIDFSRMKHFARGLGSLLRSRYLRDKILAPTRERSYQEALSHFAAAARANRPTTPDPWDGYRSLAVIEAAEESARTARGVSVSDLVDEDPAR